VCPEQLEELCVACGIIGQSEVLTGQVELQGRLGNIEAEIGDGNRF
jgi:hypothetical protein